jgi:F-box and WD-40 domain protein CDC4
MDAKDSKKPAVKTEDDADGPLRSPSRTAPSPVATSHEASSSSKPSIRDSHPKPPPTPNSGIPSELPPNLPKPLLPSAPASPPTPAPSPTPHQRSSSWTEPSDAVDDDAIREDVIQDFRLAFSRMDRSGKEAWLEAMVDSCDNQLLSRLHAMVSPRLKKDPFHVLPNELCFKVCRP